MYGAFMTEGMRDCCYRTDPQHGYEDMLHKWGQGCWELVNEMVQYADYSDECASIYIQQHFEFPGVFEYEVVNEFGDWFTSYVWENGQTPTELGAKAKIATLVYWHSDCQFRIKRVFEDWQQELIDAVFKAGDTYNFKLSFSE